jgi:hypothetical protein
MRDRLMAMNPNKRIFLLLSCFFVSGILIFMINNLWFLFFVSMFFFLALLISTNIEYDKKLRNNFDDLAKDTLLKNNFKYDEFHIGDDKLSAIAINENDEKIVILHRKSINDVFNFSPIQFSNILESSIVEDGETIINVSKGSAISGALIGGIIAGGIGATVGGLSANKNSKDKIKKITLSIVVNSLKNPIYEVNFLNIISPIDKDSSLYRTRNSEVNKWHKMISVILKRNELNSNSI